MRAPRWLARHHDPERNAAEYVSGELSRQVRRWFDGTSWTARTAGREFLLGRFGRRVAEDAREPVPASLRDRVRAMILLSAD